MTRPESRHAKSDDTFSSQAAAIPSSVFSSRSSIKLNQLCCRVVEGASIHPEAGSLLFQYNLRCLALSIIEFDHKVIPTCRVATAISGEQPQRLRIRHLPN